MFRYSIDEFIASKQQEKAVILLNEISKHSVLEHNFEIESLFDQHMRSYELLEELPKLALQFGERIVMPIITRDSSEYHAKMDLKRSYDKLGKSWQDTIPYIEFSFPEDYKCAYGDAFMNVYLFFFTVHRDGKVAGDSVIHYLKKLSNLKAFL